MHKWFEFIKDNWVQLDITLLILLCVVLSLYIIELKESVFRMCRLYCDVQGGLPISSGFDCKCLVPSSQNITGFAASLILP